MVYFISFFIEISFLSIVARNFGKLSLIFAAAVKMLFQSNGLLTEILQLLFKVGAKKL